MPPTPTPNNQEIDQALKAFEKDNSNQEHSIPGVITPQTNQSSTTKEVEGVSFDTDAEAESYRAIKFYKETVEPKMVKAVIKYSGGAVKNQRQAEWILLGIVCAMVVISIVIIYHSSVISSAQPVALPQDYVIYHNLTK
jgi:hypothetical protein